MIARVADGDEHAFRELFQVYGPLMRSIIIQIVRKEEPVEDLVQDVFLRIWINRDKLPALDSPRSWILQIVYHQSFNWLRQQKVRHKAADTLAASAVLSGSEDALFFTDTSRLVQQAIDTLGGQSRRIYLMSREQGMKLSEIAETLGISLQTVKNTISRSLKVIREFLEAHGVMLPVFLLWCWPM